MQNINVAVEGMKKYEFKGKQFHEECFCCKVCRQPIGVKTFIPRDQEAVCVSCYEEQYAQRCVKCNGVTNLHSQICKFYSEVIILADWTARSMTGCWHDNVVCATVQHYCLWRRALWLNDTSILQKKCGKGRPRNTIFTARCTIVHSAVLRLHDVCPSVCLSVTLVDHDTYRVVQKSGTPGLILR